VITVIKWISNTEAESFIKSIGGIGGYFDKGMRGQADYFDCLKDEYKEYAEALRKEIIAKKIRFTGEYHDSDADDCIPLFSDNTVGKFSWRAWGDLMAAIWSQEEDKDYTYMSFYI
jgi:hypothetical protein